MKTIVDNKQFDRNKYERAVTYFGVKIKLKNLQRNVTRSNV